MSININSLEEFIKNATFKGNSPWLRPRPNADGTAKSYTLRLAPPAKGKDQPFFTAKQHYIVAGSERINGACPGAACPACRWFFDLMNVIDRDNEKAFWAAARKLSPSDRYYANFVDRSTDTIKIWSMSYNVFTNLMNTLTNYLKKGVDISDPETGHDFTIFVEKKGSVQNYGSLMLDMDKSPIGIENWEEELHNLEELALQRILTPEDIEAAIPDALAEFYPEALKRLGKVTQDVDGGLLD